MATFEVSTSHPLGTLWPHGHSLVNFCSIFGHSLLDFWSLSGQFLVTSGQFLIPNSANSTSFGYVWARTGSF